MRLFVITLFTAIMTAAILSAQPSTGVIVGTVTAPRGALSGVKVRTKNLQTGKVLETVTASGGSYSLQLAPGTYDVFVTHSGYGPFAGRQVVVASGKTLRVDAALTEILNFGTPGELGFLLERDQQAVPTGKTPRAANGKPDLSGVWFPGPDLEPEMTPYRDWAAALGKERAARPGDDPRAQCLPSGVARANNFDLSKIVQMPDLMIMLFEGSPPGFRQIFLDGRPHPKDLDPTWMGHSVGTWEGDTLVIDMVGFNDKGWLDGARPQTEQLHVVERFRRPDLAHLDLVITVDDPGTYTRPWKIHRVLELAPKEEIHEYICNENNKPEHFVPN